MVIQIADGHRKFTTTYGSMGTIEIANEKVHSVGTSFTVAAPAQCSVEIVTSLTEFDALETDWTALLEETEAAVFQSFEWQRTWWKHFGEDGSLGRLHIVTLRSRGRLVAIAPLFIESITRLGVVHLRKLTFIGRDTTDYLDLIVTKGFEAEFVRKLATLLAKRTLFFDVIHLIDMPDRSGIHALLYEELARQGFRGEHFVNEYCPRTKLQTTWEATLASLPSNKRASLKRVQRKIDSDFKVELQLVTDPAKLPHDFTEFINLHQKRWNESGHLGVFADARTASFHREISEIALQRKWLFLAFLVLDGKRIAANYGFMYRKELSYYLSGIEMQGELAKYSLGRALHLYSINEAIKQGIEVYDFMRGTERYKYDFNSADVTNWTIFVYPGNIGLIRLRFKIVLLIDSMKRRVARERLLWAQVSKDQRALSGGMAGHIARRIQTDFRDGIQKLKSPEKSLTAHELKEKSSTHSSKENREKTLPFGVRNHALNAQVVVLTGDGDRGALDFLRSFARENICSVVVSTEPNDIASRSRYCETLVLVRSYKEEHDAHNLRVLQELGERFSDKPILVYGEDINMLFISRNRDVLQKYYRFLMPPRGLAETFVNKTEFQQLAESKGIPVPKTRVVYSYEELVHVSQSISYPAFVKPAFTMNWSFDTPELKEKYRSYKFALRQFYSAEEMLSWCRDLPLGNGGALVQEFIEGSDREVFSFHAYFDEHSQPVAYFVGRKIRTYPMHHGGSAFIETVDEPAAAKIGIESLQKVNFSGIVKIDMKRNPRDGSFKILEVNPRYTLWESLGAFAGMNLCTIARRHLRGELTKPVKPAYAVGYKWLFFKQDFRAFFTGYWRGGEFTLWQYLNSLRGKKIYQLWDWKDPVPSCVSAYQFCLKNGRKVVRKITGS